MRPTSPLALLLVLLVPLAACGGDSDDDDRPDLPIAGADVDVGITDRDTSQDTGPGVADPPSPLDVTGVWEGTTNFSGDVVGIRVSLSAYYDNQRQVHAYTGTVEIDPFEINGVVCEEYTQGYVERMSYNDERGSFTITMERPETVLGDWTVEGILLGTSMSGSVVIGSWSASPDECRRISGQISAQRVE